MPYIEGAIFDLDGTLLDSMGVWRGFGERYLASYGIQARSDMPKVIHKLSMWEAAEYLKREYPLNKSEAEIVQELNKMIEDSYFHTVTAKPGVREFLHLLHDNGVKMCVATATDRYQVEAVLKREGLISLFEKIYTCSEVGVGKQKPDIYLQAWETLQTPKENTWVFEDMLYAVKTVTQADFHVVAVRDEHSLEDEQALRSLADKYIYSYADLDGFFSMGKQ